MHLQVDRQSVGFTQVFFIYETRDVGVPEFIRFKNIIFHLVCGRSDCQRILGHSLFCCVAVLSCVSTHS